MNGLWEPMIEADRVALAKFDALPLDSAPELFLQRNAALRLLASALRRGNLAIFVGAGISMAATEGFPNWVTLAERCCKKGEVEFDRTKAIVDSRYVRLKMREVRSALPKSGYLAVVEAALYEGVAYNDALLRTPVLAALGSLVMGAVRGAANVVFNYNYDDVLEWFLDSHGFKTRAVSKAPALYEEADVTVYHPHGFLPLTQRYKALRSSEVVLDQDSYHEAVESRDGWAVAQEYVLGTNVALFVGMSGADDHVAQLCWRTYRGIGRQRLLGVTVLPVAERVAENETASLANGLASIYAPRYEDVPEILLDVCRVAALIPY